MKNIINEGNLYNPNFLDVFNVTDELGSTLEIMHDSAITTTLIDVKNHIVNPQFDADYVAINFTITEISVDGGVTLIPGTGDKTVLSGVWTKVDDFFIKIIYDNLNLNIYTVVPDNFVVKMAGFRVTSTNIKVSDYFISETPVITPPEDEVITEQVFYYPLTSSSVHVLNGFQKMCSFKTPEGILPNEIRVSLITDAIDSVIVTPREGGTPFELYPANYVLDVPVFQSSDGEGYKATQILGTPIYIACAVIGDVLNVMLTINTVNQADLTGRLNVNSFAQSDFIKITALY